MGKAEIKVLFRQQWPTSIVTVLQQYSDPKSCFVPTVSTDNTDDDRLSSLCDIRSVIQDAGILFHSFQTGSPGEVCMGDQLMSFALSNVERAFQRLPHCDTFCLLMDKPTVPRAKGYVQADRSGVLRNEMERNTVDRVDVGNGGGGALPCLVAKEQPLPEWLAVRADRVVYTLALGQLFALIEQTYKPPAGKRLVLDYMPLESVLPNTVEEWLMSERIVFSGGDGTRARVEKARERLYEMEKKGGDWRAEARRFVVALARAHLLTVAPVCIETDLRGITYAPFVLRNAANACGEADIGTLFWLNALAINNRAHTFVGTRLIVGLNETEKRVDANEFYTPSQLAAHRDAMLVDESVVSVRDLVLPLKDVNPRDFAPMTDIQTPHAKRVELARVLLQKVSVACDDVYADQSPSEGVAAQCAKNPLIQMANALVGTELTPTPNRALVMTSDTDFLTLLALWCIRSESNTADAPLLSIGLTNVRRAGAVVDLEKDYVLGKSSDPGAVAHEIFDVARLSMQILADLREARAAHRPIIHIPPHTSSPPPPKHPHHGTHEVSEETETISEDGGSISEEVELGEASDIELMSNFAVFCASCENDYLGGLGYVNRAHMFKAFIAVGAHLGEFKNQLLHLNVALYTNYIKRCYYESQRAATKKVLIPAFHNTTYEQLASHIREKYKQLKRHMPTSDALALMFQRTQWWISYALHAHADAQRVLDERLWGWQKHTRTMRV